MERENYQKCVSKVNNLGVVGPSEQHFHLLLNDLNFSQQDIITLLLVKPWRDVARYWLSMALSPQVTKNADSSANTFRTFGPIQNVPRDIWSMPKGP